MRSGTGWITASLLAAALCLLAVGPASAADGEFVVSADQSDSLGVVVVAQSDGSDQEPGSDLRLVDRESSERVDAVVIALWSIAAGMTVLLAVFLWHTSPRRRLRLARSRSAQLAEEAAAAEEAEEAGGESGMAEPAEVAGVSESAVAEPAEAPESAVAEPVGEPESAASESAAEPAVESRPMEQSESADGESAEADEPSEQEPEPAEEAEEERGQGFWPRLGHALGLD